MKKYILMLFGVLMALPMAARDFFYEYEGQTLAYTVLDEDAKTVQTRAGVSYTPGNDVSGDLVIPSVVKDGNVEYTVIKIGTFSFWNRTGLTSVTLPETLTAIGDRGFDTCKALTEITIPNSVQSIGSFAFVKCSGLTELTIGNSVTYIGSYAFSECSSLTVVTIPNSVTSIDSYAFSSCSDLKEVTIPESLPSVGASVFSNCKAIETVYFNAENYGAGVFPATLKNIYFGENVKTIADYAFKNNNGLTSVTIPNSVTSIGVQAFYECPNLTSVTFGESLKTIGVDAFRLCRALTSVVIPNSVETMGRDIFVDCTGLTSVTIGKSLSSMGVNVFYRCNNIKYFVILSEHIVYNPEGLSEEFTMYVPASKLEEYKQTFSTNTKVTIIPLSNFEPEATEGTFNIGVNESKSLALNLVGATAVTAFQTDITLPAGLAIAETEDGALDVTLGEGKTGTHVVAASKVSGDNTYRIIVYSTKNEPFTDGTDLLNITLTANPTSRSGSSDSNSNGNITIGNTLIALTGDQGISPEDVTITVPAFIGVESVTVTPANADLNLGKTLTLIAEVAPANASNKALIWASSNPEVATVSEDGVVTPVAKGNVTITATTTDGTEVSGSAEINVTNYAQSFTLGEENVTIEENMTMQLTPVFTPANAEMLDLTWESTDVSVAYVDESNVLHSVNPGTATVTATNAASGLTASINVTVTAALSSGVESLTPDTLGETVDIYNLQGICLRRNATADDIRALTPGLYIVRGKKVMVK